MENRRGKLRSRWSDIENVMAVNKEKEFCIKFCSGERQWGRGGNGRAPFRPHHHVGRYLKDSPYIALGFLSSLSKPVTPHGFFMVKRGMRQSGWGLFVVIVIMAKLFSLCASCVQGDNTFIGYCKA